MSTSDTRVDDLLALDARAWALLVRALRNRSDLPGPVADAVALPSGELSSGPGRRALCEALDAEADLVEALRDDAALPAAVHRALGHDAGADGVGGDGAGPRRAEAPAVEGDPSARDDGRLRPLRRSLEEERRRREGAEARAASAESRSEALTAQRDAALARVSELEEELARTADSVERTAARAERRSSSRAEGLERELAAERSTHAALRREHERVRAELAVARAEVDELRARRSVDVGRDGAGAAGRPLVLPDDLAEGTTEAARWLAAKARVLIVDGYNATLTLRPDRSLEEQRRWLVERLRPLAARDVAAPVVIFDGDRSSGRMTDTGGVEVRFTAAGVIADDEIVFAVAATDEPVLVVTDDVELGRRVGEEGGNVVGVVHLAGIIEG